MIDPASVTAPDLAEAIEILRASHACPTCGATGGFHDDIPHGHVRARIDPALTWKPGEMPIPQREADE